MRASAARREPRRRRLGGRAAHDPAARTQSSRGCASTGRSASRSRAASCSRSTTSHWIDPPAFGAASPRTVYFMAKVEAHRVPGLGQLIRAFGTFSVRRGESDREAVRLMREVVATGRRSGSSSRGRGSEQAFPGEVQPGAAMAALQEDVPGRPGAIHGAQAGGRQLPARLGRVGRADALRRAAADGRGYREASARDRGARSAAVGMARRDPRGRPARRRAARRVDVP